MATSKKKVAKKTVSKKAAPKGKTKPVIIPAKGDIVTAFGKHFRVDSSSKKEGTVHATAIPHVDAKILGNLSRVIAWTSITAIYKDAGYHG